MPTKAKYFPNQEEEEKVYLLLRKHWFVYVIFGFFVFLILVPPSIFIIYYLTNASQLSSEVVVLLTAILSVFFLSMLAVLLYGFVDYYLDVYIITNKRLVNISQNGFFNREIAELHLHEIQDVNAKVNGIFETFFHFGDVYIQTAGERENVLFNTIPHPYAIAKQIIDLHEVAIEKSPSKGKKTVNVPNKTPFDGKEDPEKGLWIHQLEKQAKKIVKETSLIKKIKSGGLSISSELKKDFVLDTGKKMYRADECDDSKNTKEEGELCEGKEIDLTK